MWTSSETYCRPDWRILGGVEGVVVVVVAGEEEIENGIKGSLRLV